MFWRWLSTTERFITADCLTRDLLGKMGSAHRMDSEQMTQRQFVALFEAAVEKHGSNPASLWCHMAKRLEGRDLAVAACAIEAFTGKPLPREFWNT